MQIHGTAMGPHNACSYADLSMGEFDDKALNGYKISPQIWWRFRDDIFSFWEHGEEALMEFLEKLNSFHPTIKFTAEWSREKINYLDVSVIRIGNRLQFLVACCHFKRLSSSTRVDH